mgnify:CR=1 FL=1|tara:strand:- start:1689 stop:2363 length:675 start_codon:yes stop_codon:yes gene_type:complete
MAWWGYLIVAVFYTVSTVYLTSYIKKKAKDLATKENLENLKLQLHETTVLTKSIEQHITSDVWVAQQRWQIKKDFYSDALAKFETIVDGLRLIELSVRGSDDNYEAAPSSKIKEKEQAITRANTELEHQLQTVGVLFLDSVVVDGINNYLNAERTRRGRLEQELLDPTSSEKIEIGEQLYNYSSYLSHQLSECSKAQDLLRKFAREDLQVIWKSKSIANANSIK